MNFLECFKSAERSKRCSYLLREELRCFLGREVAALVDLVEESQVAIGSLYPAPRRSVSKSADLNAGSDIFRIVKHDGNSVQLPAAEMSAAIDVQDVTGDRRGVGQIHDRVRDVLDRRRPTHR